MIEINETDKRTDGTPDNDKSNTNSDINTINSLKSEARNEIQAHYYKEPDSPVERVKFEGLDDGDSIDSDHDYTDKKLPPIPDGGWGWVVVVAAFLVSACADGLAFSFGLLHEQFTEHFNSTQSETSLIGSLFIATPLLAGPIMSALVDRFGCRTMTMLAGAMSTAGFLLASISNSVGMLCLTFGFLSGLAMGILYVTAVVSVAFWFDKRRNLAVSLASCGIGFGTLVYSPITHSWLESYGWRSTIILLAGTLLNMCVCGALMRNPEWLIIKQKQDRKLSKARSRKSSSAGSISSRSLGGESTYLDAEELKNLLESGKSPEYILATLASNIQEAEELEATTQANADQVYKRMHSAIHLPTFIQQNEKVPPEVIEKLMENKRLYNIILQNYPHLIQKSKSDVNINMQSSRDAVAEPAQLPIEIKAKKDKTEAEKHRQKHESGDAKNETKKSNPNVNSNHKDQLKDTAKDKPKETAIAPPMTWLRQISTTDHHYLKDMPLHKNSMMHRGAMLSITRYKLKASSLPDMYKNSSWSIDSGSDDEWRWYNRAWRTVTSTFDFKMFTEFHFLMFNLSSLILSIWFIVPYFFLKQFMDVHHVDGGEQMISIIGVASGIGIVSLGWSADQSWMNVTKAYAVCLFVCGTSVAFYPVYVAQQSYLAIAVNSSIFGLSFASSYSYTPAILMELMPLQRFTVAYGLILLSQGIGHLVGPPIGGMLFDVTGSWDLTFYMGGAWLIISGLCVGVIAFTKDARICGTSPLLKEAAEAVQSTEV